jgi:predicted RNase H-like HicB family nuclease
VLFLYRDLRPDETMAAMENRYTAVFEQVDDWWIGFVEELPGCNVQERSLDEARSSLKVAIQDVLQANRELARRESEGHQVVREAVAVPVE